MDASSGCSRFLADTDADKIESGPSGFFSKLIGKKVDPKVQ
jgi:hypothetical protein